MPLNAPENLTEMSIPRRCGKGKQGTKAGVFHHNALARRHGRRKGLPIGRSKVAHAAGTLADDAIVMYRSLPP